MIPRVSVVITTHARPHLVGRAIASVLRQTMPDLEVIVVMDGPDPETRRVLEGIQEPRLRIHELAQRRGQAAAINAGVTLARAPWAAMLDDDDEWMPEKLDVQLQAAHATGLPNPVVGCRFWARSERGDTIWPLRPPRANEPICEYLFCRTRWEFGEGIQPTSTLLAPTSLFRRCPLNEHLAGHTDLDWLVRIDRLAGTSLVLPESPMPLAIWNMQSGRERISNHYQWRRSHHWISCIRESVTARAFAGYLLTWVSLAARSRRDFRAFPYLLKEAFTRGRPRPTDLAVYFAIWGLPLGWRSRFSYSLSTRNRCTWGTPE